MSKLELAIDLGSSFITIFQKGKHIVLKEPTIALLEKNKNLELVEIGSKALSMLGRTSKNLQPVYPIKEGVLVYPEVVSLMIEEFIERLAPRKFVKPRVSALILISETLNVEERKTIEKAMLKAGIKEVTLLEAPITTFVYNECKNGLYVDIGADNTNVNYVNENGIVSGYSVNVGGNIFNNLIIDYFIEKYGLKIGKYTAEKFKKTVGSLYSNDVNIDEVRGTDVISGSTQIIEASASDVASAIYSTINSIVEVIESLMNISSSEVVNSILKSGIYLSGGSSLMPGLEEYISDRVNLKVTSLKDCTNANCLGAGVILDNKNVLSKLMGIKNIG